MYMIGVALSVTLQERNMGWKMIIVILSATVCWGQKPDERLIGSVEGAALFKAYCAVCHGADGKGGGAMAKSLKVSPADLTHVSARNGGSFPAARLRRVISGEDVVAAGHGTREMPVWGPIFSVVDRDQDLGKVRIDNLTRYLEKLQAK
jgi:mono/diheme cytochrome c family protein